jgi:hypothetical protein
MEVSPETDEIRFVKNTWGDHGSANRYLESCLLYTPVGGAGYDGFFGSSGAKLSRLERGVVKTFSRTAKTGTTSN